MLFMFSHSEKMNEGLMHVTTWMDTENSPSDRSQTENTTQIRAICTPSIHQGCANSRKAREQLQKKKTESEWRKTFQTVGQVATVEVGLWSGL